MQVLGGGQVGLAHLLQRLFHRVEGVAAAGQNAKFNQPVKGFGQGLLGVEGDIVEGGLGLVKLVAIDK